MADYIEHNGTAYDAGTPQMVIRELERARRGGYPIRLFYGDQETGRTWSEEYDITGRVSRSAGSHKIPILLHNARSIGGGAILTACVVGILGARDRGGVEWLYKHLKFDNGAWTCHASQCEEYPNLTHEVRRDGKVNARFRTMEQAERYRAFMAGERLRR